VVIGGLTLDDQQETVRQVPILGDIPILGWLFRTTSSTHQKNTLFLFLTPRILSDPNFQDLDEISTRKKAEIAALDGQVELVDPEFGRRFDMRDQRRTIDDIEASRVFDLGVVYSPLDEEVEKAAEERGKAAGDSSPGKGGSTGPKEEVAPVPEKPASGDGR
jgi:general secretion pathway protein D